MCLYRLYRLVSTPDIPMCLHRLYRLVSTPDIPMCLYRLYRLVSTVWKIGYPRQWRQQTIKHGFVFTLLLRTVCFLCGVVLFYQRLKDFNIVWTLFYLLFKDLFDDNVSVSGTPFENQSDCLSIHFSLIVVETILRTNSRSFMFLYATSTAQQC